MSLDTKKDKGSQDFEIPLDSQDSQPKKGRKKRTKRKAVKIVPEKVRVSLKLFRKRNLKIRT